MPSRARDFKSLASADFAILAYLCTDIQLLCNAKDFKSLASACFAIPARFCEVFIGKCEKDVTFFLPKILSPLRLPIPPQRHMKFISSARRRPRPQSRPQPRRERLTALPYRPRVTKKASPKTMPFAWRRHPDLNRGVKVLQTFALPLGYGAKKTVRKVRLERETRLEPATFTLAR